MSTITLPLPLSPRRRSSRLLANTVPVATTGSGKGLNRPLSKSKMSLQRKTQQPERVGRRVPTQRKSKVVLATVSVNQELSDDDVSSLLKRFTVDVTAVSGRLCVAVVSGKIGVLEDMQKVLAEKKLANVIIQYPGTGLLAPLPL
jgi:hypothetical protein